LEIPLALPDYGRMTGDAEVIEYFRIADNTPRIGRFAYSEQYSEITVCVLIDPNGTKGGTR
jgi:hypothetical protein